MTDEINGLKQRLVGAIVILSLAVIFLPMVFDKPHMEEAARIVSVPPAPEMKTLTIKKPERPSYDIVELDERDGQIKPVPQSRPVPANIEGDAAAVDKSSSDTTDSKSDTKLNDAQAESSAGKKEVESASKPRIQVVDNRPSAMPRVSQLPPFKNIWLVQVGTFSDANNAYGLRDRMRKAGFDTHTKKVQRNGKTVIQVFTGPFVNKREAQRTKVKVDDEYRVKSLLVYIDK